jgi:HD-GYP domain-containing protein (c-di-GMP phosphodiesterase class II)
MSSPRHSDGPSPAAEGAGEPRPTVDRVSDTRLRGEPLVAALEEHAPGSREHADATSAYAFSIAVEIGLGREDCELIREAARIHEVGKLYLPAGLLAKQPIELTAAEREQIASYQGATHTLALGAGIREEVCTWLLLTRERYDGAGPGRLAGDGIPIASRIIRVGCAYRTLLESHSAVSPEEARRGALGWLRAAGGAELDPGLVEGLSRVLERAMGSAAP